MALALFGFAVLPVAARPKTDVVVLKDGDRLKGEISSLKYGILSFSTDAAGTINIKWTHVVSITSEFDYEIEVTADDRYYGSLVKPGKAGELRIEGQAGTHDFPLLEVVSIAPIQHGFWKKLDGSINLGLSYTQSNQALQYSFNGDGRYRTRKRLESLRWNSIFNTQTGGDSASQHSVSFHHTRFLKTKLSPFALGQLESNPAQGYDLRSSVGGGVGWPFIRKFSEDLVATGGLVYIREEVEGSIQVDNSAAALVGIEFASYSYDHPQRTVTIGLNTFSNVTDTPRFRLQLHFKLSWEIVSNFAVNINVQDSYDSRPPTVDAENNDLSVVTSLGYSF